LTSEAINDLEHAIQVNFNVLLSVDEFAFVEFMISPKDQNHILNLLELRPDLLNHFLTQGVLVFLRLIELLFLEEELDESTLLLLIAIVE
jgi:hypothetical protein